MKKVQQQICDLDIPYPEKLLLKSEVEDHLLNYGGHSNGFTSEELKELHSLHNTTIYMCLKAIEPNLRRWVEFSILAAPMVGLFYFFVKEDIMWNFIYEGGVHMYPILLLGGVLTFRELSLFFRTVVAKDHAEHNLNLDTNSVFVGGFALIALGIGGTALGLYITASGMASSNASMEIFFYGLRESLGGIILSSSIATFVFLIHFITRRLLISWKAPVTN